MHFENLHYSTLFLLLPVLIIVFILAGRRRQKMLSQFVDAKLFGQLIPANYQRMILWKNILLFSVFVFAVLTLMRPQWGFEWQDIKREGVDVMLVVDTSKSMLTADVRPNRLERTKLAIRDLLKKLNGDRVGLVAFAGDAFLMCPLTVDYSGFALTLNDLDVGTVARGGTNLETAINETINRFDTAESKFKAIVIATDGEEVEGAAMRAAQKAKEKGIKIYTVGIGTPEGELIQVTNDKGEKEFLKDESGNIVKSRLNESLLKDMAQLTGGAYIRSAGLDFGLDYIYENYLTKMDKREFQNKREKKFYERFQYPLTIAVIVFFIYLCLDLRRQKLA